MDTITVVADHRVELHPDAPKTVKAGRTLAVTATYLLSEEGRKASLLEGGNGRATQEITVEVPANRLHLVSVDAHGVARLKLRPRYQRDEEQRVARVDAPPTYDSPPSLDDLFLEASRNHQLESAYLAQRTTSRSERRGAQREARAEVARAFLSDLNQRALGHPPPTPKRCAIATEDGRVLFDADTDKPPARDVPPEAYRRFRTDLRARQSRSQQGRAAQLAVHEEKKRFIAEWIAAHGTVEQQDRQAAGMLPMDEALEALADEAFAALGDRPRYTRDGVARLQAHLRRDPRYTDVIVTAGALSVISTNAVKATAAQWAILKEVQALVPHATATLRAHRLSWKQDPHAAGITVIGVLVVLNHGPFTLRREYEVECVAS
jgi:hypothetical protein